MKTKKFTEKQIDQFWSFIHNGILDQLSDIGEDDTLEGIAERLHALAEGKYFREVLTAQDAVEAFDERAELGELFESTAQRIARNKNEVTEYLSSAAGKMGVTIIEPLDNANVGNRRRITDFLGIQWYSTDEQVFDELKRWL